ncbi:hypothetical protein NSK_007930 [Nannochloropsis salina CCMP1776]|uniref:Uncharacterized protein n=1 Tax=Nannochloropsis salina CCMP1776 TaxID=1027361 RepID=A0A4D9CT90_9STRA|nr:hypothetical protein NSK_007930 [Nannochloropsis salina CCMP1776]|eukprot:TFJ80753.1 hypothetical protein NSK_007930 [Nannochloropsis salina CCMP1776]
MVPWRRQCELIYLTSAKHLCFFALFLLLAWPPLVHADAAAAVNHGSTSGLENKKEAYRSDPAHLIVPTGHDTKYDKVDELTNLLQQKVAALVNAEKAITSLENQLNIASKQLETTAQSLSASDRETSRLTQEVKELKHKLDAAEASAVAATAQATVAVDTATAAAKEETAAWIARAEKAEAGMDVAVTEATRLKAEAQALQASVAAGKGLEGQWSEEKARLEKELAIVREEKDQAVAGLERAAAEAKVRVEEEKEGTEAAMGRMREEAAAAVAEEREKAAAAVSKAQEELSRALQVEREKREEAVSAAMGEATRAKTRVQALEREVADADRRVASAQEQLSGKLAQREKETEALRAKLEEVLATKYTWRALSGDFSAFSGRMAALTQAKARCGIAWAAQEGKRRGEEAGRMLQPHVEAARMVLGSQCREMEKRVQPLWTAHVLPPYREHVEPRLAQAAAYLGPVWEREVRPRLLQGWEWGKRGAGRARAWGQAQWRAGKRRVVIWVRGQDWAVGLDAERVVTSLEYVLVATFFFLLRHLLWRLVMTALGLVVGLITLPFRILFWVFFWPVLLFGGKRKAKMEVEGPQRGGAGKAGGGGGKGRGAPGGPPPTHPLAHARHGR